MKKSRSFISLPTLWFCFLDFLPQENIDLLITHALKAKDGLNSKHAAKIIYWILDEDINTFDVYIMTCALPGSILSILKWT
jgi:hypothetical protein